METIPKGFCQCGCGQKTKIAPYTDRRGGWIRGEPIRYIFTHHPNTRNGHGFTWNGGRVMQSEGYWTIRMPGHPRAARGYVLEHIVKAEVILGKPLPDGVQIHHPFGKGNNDVIVICQDRTYHKLLHKRTRAFHATGNAKWEKCCYCKKYDSPDNLIHPKKGASRHAQCRREYSRKRYALDPKSYTEYRRKRRALGKQLQSHIALPIT